ncbi:unnamed protein product, partial [Rotaria sordida]
TTHHIHLGTTTTTTTTLAPCAACIVGGTTDCNDYCLSVTIAIGGAATLTCSIATTTGDCLLAAIPGATTGCASDSACCCGP